MFHGGVGGVGGVVFNYWEMVAQKYYRGLK
jgi:hypothetical protein